MRRILGSVWTKTNVAYCRLVDEPYIMVVRHEIHNITRMKYLLIGLLLKLQTNYISDFMLLFRERKACSLIQKTKAIWANVLKKILLEWIIVSVFKWYVPESWEHPIVDYYKLPCRWTLLKKMHLFILITLTRPPKLTYLFPQ